MIINRRHFIHRCTFSAAGLLVPAYGFAQPQSEYNELAIPPLETGVLAHGKRSYQLRAQYGKSQFVNGRDSQTIGINGAYLGPSLLLRKGEDISLQVSNQLDEPTAIHWHGLHVPAISDGGPHQLIEPGANWQPEFIVRQDAGTFWYHAHTMEHTAEQVYRGLAGMLVIEDEASRNSSLPQDYGVDDIPLIVQDRRFDEDGYMEYTIAEQDLLTGFLGDTVLVNGTLNPLFSPRTTKVRFRLLNAANARVFNFAFSDGRLFDLVSNDGGLLNAPLPMTSLVLSPGERADIVVEFNSGRPVELVSLPLSDNSPFAPKAEMRSTLAVDRQAIHILSIEPDSPLQQSVPLAAALATNPRIPESEAVRARSLTLSMISNDDGLLGRGQGSNGNDERFRHSYINDQSMDMKVINLRIPVNSTEIWQINNISRIMHPFHIHHNQFQILSRNGLPPSADEMGYKDTVKVGPGEIVRVIMRFENFADSEHPYMYHCHILEHEDDGMMGQFVVE